MANRRLLAIAAAVALRLKGSRSWQMSEMFCSYRQQRTSSRHRRRCCWPLKGIGPDFASVLWQELCHLSRVILISFERDSFFALSFEIAYDRFGFAVEMA